MTPETEVLIETLGACRIILKSGDYDGVDLMRAWCAMNQAAAILHEQAAEIERLREALEPIRDNIDEADFSEAGPRLHYAEAINATLAGRNPLLRPLQDVRALEKLRHPNAANPKRTDTPELRAENARLRAEGAKS